HRLASWAGPIRTRGGCSYGFGAGFSFVVGAPPPVRTAHEASTDQRPGQAPIHTRGGCSYGFAGRVWFICRRTAPVRTANEAGTDLRPGQAPFAPGARAPTGSAE